MSARTVRDVLVEWLGDEAAVADALRDLREVLSTGEGWVRRDLPTAQVQPGDVVVDKRGRLWAVTATPGSDKGGVAPEIVRGAREAYPEWSLDATVPVLVRRDDARALALLERELGAEAVSREVRG